jgi:large subunit ribosomal protein L1
MAEAKKAKKDKEIKEAEVIAEAAPVKTKKTPATEAKKVIEQIEEAKEPVVEKVTKAGKHSSKALAEAEAKQAKEKRKTTPKTEAGSEKPKEVKKATRPKAERAGKKYREIVKLVEKDKVYNLNEALALVVKTSTTKFDSTVELHVNLGVDPKQADQNIRETVVLPAGTGKELRVAVFAEADDIAKAKKAGADIAAGDEFLQQLEKENLDFDVLISTPALMAKLGKYARLLGPRGLMPNPKSGTVTTDVVSAIKEAKAGRVEFRVDQAGIIHLGIGKVSFGPEKLQQNAEAVTSSIKAAKPASLKGVYVKASYITTTMGPSIKVQV